MIQPDDIRQKAERLYPTFLKAWLGGDTAFFPRVSPSSKTLDSTSLAAAAAQVQRLREGSREVRGFGYTVEWEDRKSRAFGQNRFPARIVFASQEDFLRFLDRRSEFAAFSAAVERLRGEFPVLEDWIRSHHRLLIESADELDGLLHVLRYFRDQPRPNRFARELPLPVDTKFIERHERVLRDWFDLVLPPHMIRADESHFERRYGLRYAEPHLMLRVLDPALQTELGLPCAELSLPLHTLAELPVRDAAVFIVENKVNLLTLPPLPRVLGLGALGDGVVLLRYLPWLAQAPISYWGDLDVEGFEILASLRNLFPETRSFLMDETALNRWPTLIGSGTGRRPHLPPQLTDLEAAAFRRCRDDNLRLEQERLRHHEVLAMLVNSHWSLERLRMPVDETPAPPFLKAN